MLRRQVVDVDNVAGVAGAHPRAGNNSGFAHDLRLARAAAQGSELALRVLIKRAADKLHNVAWRMTYDHHEAQDLCQEGLVKATSPAVLARYRGSGPLDAYVIKVGVRAMLNARQARSMREWRELEIVQTPGAAYEPCAAPSARGLDPSLRHALEALPPRSRVIVLLIAVGDFSYQETAALTGLPLGTVKSAYSRACSAVRRSLAIASAGGHAAVAA